MSETESPGRVITDGGLDGEVRGAAACADDTHMPSVSDIAHTRRERRISDISLARSLSPFFPASCPPFRAFLPYAPAVSQKLCVCGNSVCKTGRR
eukprot:2622527-Rhodomonas_salina.1